MDPTSRDANPGRPTSAEKRKLDGLAILSRVVCDEIDEQATEGAQPPL